MPVREDDVTSEAVHVPAAEFESVASDDRSPAPTPPVGSVEHSERVLVSRLRRRDAAAFESLVRANQHRVYDFCVRMLSDREEAFDVTQEVFISIHQNLENFRADARLTTWIFRIARNHCLNRIKYLKRRGRGRSEEFGEPNELRITESLGGTASPHDALSATRERQLVHRAVQFLDEEQRALVVLRDVEGLSYEEIATAMGCPIGTVRSRIFRAREAISAKVRPLLENQSGKRW